jgi:hypothetical protein
MNNEDKSWNSLTPRELRNAKIVSIIFLAISILAFLFLSKVIGGILLFIWIISGSGPFILGSKNSMKNKIHVLKMIELGYNDWDDREIEKQIKAIEECGYKWFEQKGRVSFRHTKTGLYLKMEGLHLYSPERIKETYKRVWSKDNSKKAFGRHIFDEITKEAMSDRVVSDILSTIGDMDKVSKADYAKAVITGKNKVVNVFCKEKNNKVVNEKHLHEKEFIITISDNVLIITKKIGEKQIPISVKRWKKVYNNSSFFQSGIEYEDSSGNIWLYIGASSSGQEALTMKNKIKEQVIFIFE